MRLLITGASGLLGRKLVSLAIRAGHEVYSIYKTHPLIEGNPQQVDICDKAAIDRLMTERSPDAVIHAASITDVDLCELHPDLAMRVNGIATGFIAEASQEIGSFLIYVSTDYVFDGRRGRYREEDAPNPINAYGRSKLLGERQVAQHSDNFCIARTSVVYGWGREYRANFATWVYEKLRTKQEAKVVTDQYASPTLSSQLARMLLEVAERRLHGIFHLAGSTRISRYGFAIQLAQKFGFEERLLVPVRSDSINWIAKRPLDSSLDVSKALEMLNNKPSAINDALDEFVREAPAR